MLSYLDSRGEIYSQMSSIYTRESMLWSLLGFVPEFNSDTLPTLRRQLSILALQFPGSR